MAKKAAKKKAVSKKAAVKRSSRAMSRTQPVTHMVSSGELEHSLNALLHTMRCIAQHEDELCTLLHDARKRTRPTRALLRELASILTELPDEDYVDDLHAVQQMMNAS